MTEMKPLLDRFPDPWTLVLEVPATWYPRLVQLDAELAEVVPDYTLQQVKVKFGGLRFYAEYPDGTAAEDVSRAEVLIAQAAQDCEQILPQAGYPPVEPGTTTTERSQRR